MKSSLDQRVFFLILAVVMTATGVNGAPQPSKSQAVRQPFSLAISLPQNIIGADSELPLEITLTNVSSQDISVYPMEPIPLWAIICQVDIQDDKGAPVPHRPLKEYLRRTDEPWATTANVSFPLLPGKQLQVEILLNRVFDLSKPGKYTIQAQRKDSSGLIVKSNTATALIVSPVQPKKQARPSFSITLRAPYDQVDSGFQMPVEIAVKNVSKHEITLGDWRAISTSAAGLDNEFASGLEIYDAQGNPASLTKMGQDLRSYDDVPAGQFRFTSIRPGSTGEERKIVGSLFDLTQPGKYTMQVSLVDPVSHLLVKSNPITFMVGGTEQTPTARAPKFLLGIEAPHDGVPGSRPGVYLYLMSALDHAIDLGAQTNNMQIFDALGNPVPLTEEGKRNQGPFGVTVTLPYSVHVQAGKFTLSGVPVGRTVNAVITVDSFYDLSRPGRYTVQMSRFDEESHTVVKSNKVTVTVRK